MKKWGLLILLIVLSFTLLGICTKKKPNDELVFWTLQMRDFSPYMEKVIATFEKDNPDIKVKWIDIPFSEGEKRTLAAILSDTPPDLVNLNPDFSTLLAKKGTLTEIPEEALTSFSPEIVKSMKFNGKNYFIPWYATSALTFSNKKALKKVPKTYNEIFALCYIKSSSPPLNASLNREPFVAALSNTPLRDLAHVPYHEIFSDNNANSVIMFNFAENDSMLKLLNKYGINSPEMINSQLAIDLYKTIQEAYASHCFPKESLTQTHRESLEKYMAGEVLMFEGGSNFLNMIKENAPKTFAQTAISSQLTGETGKYNFSMMNFIIPIKSKKQSEALKFALFLTNTENQLELARLTNILATDQKALADEFYTKAPEDDIFAQARVLSAKQLSNLQPQPFYPNRKELITLINNATQKILLKQDAIENVLNKLRSDWSQLNN